MKKCEICGKEYESNSRKYLHCCSDKCLKIKKEKYETPSITVCLNCGKEYFRSNPGWNWNKNNELVKVKGSALASQGCSSDKFCCYECGKEYSSKKASITSLKKYGGIGFASEELREKAKKTNLENHGNANYTNIETAKQTVLEKYGVENVSKSKEVRKKISEKVKMAHLKRHEEIIDKTKKTKLEKYDNENYVNIEAAKQTNLEKYGVENYSKTEEYKIKIKVTNMKKRGVEYPIQSNEVKDLIKKNNLEKYGVENISQLPEVKEKVKQTFLNHYGVDHPSKSFEYKEKLKKSNLEKYGVEYVFQLETIKEKIKQTNLERYGVKVVTQSKEIRNKAIKTNLERYGVPYTCMTKQCREADPHAISNINKNFAIKLKFLGIESEFEYHIDKCSYDLRLNTEDNILIEINPIITHSSSKKEYLPLDRFNSKDKYYHFNKTKIALEHGYRCIHIWDWDDLGKVLNLLKNKENLYARKLKIREVSLKDTTAFLNQYHLQNSCLGQTIRLGLYKDNELIQLMTFGKPRYNKNFEYELLRLCTKSEYKVIGGAEKLFNYFIKMYNPESIISYCDNSKFTGDVYKRLSMKLKEYGTPRKHWYNIETNRHITDNLLLQRGYSQLHNDKEHKKGESNEQLMLEAGYLEIYDCGQSTYIWYKK